MQDKRGFVGRQIGEFQIQDCLGEGGFATVYRARSSTFADRNAAIKILFEHLATKQGIVERFKREAKAAFSLRHDNIVHAYDFGPVDSTWYIAMEFVEGRSLRDVLLGQGGFNVAREDSDMTQLCDEQAGDATLLKQLSAFYEPLDMGLICQVLQDICAGLDHAHGQKILHRDLKPDNILVSSAGDGKALLTDFGIACLQEEERLTRTGFRLGSVAYMSPEQILGKANIDHRSDIYSLGVTLFELLTGTVPFVGVDSVVFTKHLQDAAPHPSTLRPDLPQEIDAVVLRCLNKAPEDRYWRAGDAAADFRKVVAPKSLSTIFTGKQTRITGASDEHETAATIVNCPGCGNTFRVTESGGQCSTCLRHVDLAEGLAEHERIEQEASDFIANLRLPANQPMEVRAYEYERTAEPALFERYKTALARWSATVSGGTVAPPYCHVESACSGEVLATTRQIWNLATLLESDQVSDWALSVEAMRRRRERVAELRARAHQLLGLYHSIGGALGSTPQEMRQGYRNAFSICEQAVRELAEKKISLPIQQGLEISASLAEVISEYPENRSAAKRILETVEDVDEAALPTGAAADVALLRSYEDAAIRAVVRVDQARADAVVLLTSARERIYERDVAVKAMDTQRKAEEDRVVAARTQIEEDRVAELRRFARQGLWVRLGVVIGPLILTLIIALVMRAVKGWEGLSVPFFIALGTLTLPLAGSYLVAKSTLSRNVDSIRSEMEPRHDSDAEPHDDRSSLIPEGLERVAAQLTELLPEQVHLPAAQQVQRWGLDKFDLGPVAIVVVGIWSFLLTALYFTGPGRLVHLDVAIPGDTVRSAIVWFVILVVGWIAWILLGAERVVDASYDRDEMNSWPWPSILAGLTLALITIYFAANYVVSVWKWTGWMRWVLMATAIGLVLIGPRAARYVRQMSSAEGAADLYRKRELRRVQTEGQRLLDRLTQLQADLIQRAADEIKTNLDVVASHVAVIRSQADELSARLLRTQMPQELFDVSDLEQELAETRAALASVEAPVARQKPTRWLPFDLPAMLTDK